MKSPVNAILACTWEKCCKIPTQGSAAQQVLVTCASVPHDPACTADVPKHPDCRNQMKDFACDMLPRTLWRTKADPPVAYPTRAPTASPDKDLCVDPAKYNQGFTDWAVSHVEDVANGTLVLGGIFFLNFIAAVIDVCNDTDSAAATAAFG